MKRYYLTHLLKKSYFLYTLIENKTLVNPLPFIISGPRIKAGKESKIPITHSDILPTIIDLAGKKLNQKNNNLDGGSFKPKSN